MIQTETMTHPTLEASQVTRPKVAEEVQPREALPTAAQMREKLQVLRNSSRRIAEIGAQLLSHPTE